MRGWRRALALFVLVFVSSAYFVQGEAANQSSRFDLTRAIVEQHSFAIDPYAGNTFDKAVYGGHYYTDKAPGLSVIAVVPYALLRAFGWPYPESVALSLHVVTVLLLGIASAAAAVLFARMLVEMGVREPLAFVAAIAWTLGTNAFGYATLFLAHQLVAALLLASFFILFRESRRRPRAGQIALAGALGSVAAVSEYPAAVAGLLLFGYGVRRLGLRRMATFALAALGPVLLLGLYNRACFGGPFTLSYAKFVPGHFGDEISTGFLGLGAPRLEVLGEILFGQRRGLLPLSPFLVLLVPGAVVLWQTRALRPELTLCLAMCVYFLLLNASYRLWHAGASMGPRYLVPMLPFAVVPVAAAFEQTATLQGPWRRPLVAGIAALVVSSVAVCTMTVAVMPELLDIRAARPGGVGVPPPDMDYPIRTFVFPMFFHGQLSAKGVTPRGQLGFAITAAGHEWDAYNLGEALGLSGLRSLAPLGLVWAACLAAVFRPRRRPSG